jgi:hypothetical protein
LESNQESIKLFAIKNSKNVAAATHDEYVDTLNRLLRGTALETQAILDQTYLSRDGSGNSILHNKLIEDNHTTIRTARYTAKLLQELSGVEHTRTSCCVASCLAFTDQYSVLTECPLCDEPRYDTRGLSRATFDSINLEHLLRLQYANLERAELLKSYRKDQETTPWNGGLRDYWDGALHQEHKEAGFFTDEHDIALAFSTDGLQLFKVGKGSVWPLLITIVNLRPDIRVKKQNLIVYGIIPGPNQPKDIHSFLRPMIDELKRLEIGIKDVYDASTNTTFTLRAHLVLVSGDLPAVAKVMGISGTNSYDYCRFCSIRGLYHSKHVYCPLRSPEGWPEAEEFEFDPAELPLRTNASYRKYASENLIFPYDPNPPKKSTYGIKQYSALYELQTINFPRSFPIDIMHLIFENVMPNMHQWWIGEFLPKKSKEDGQDEDESSDEDDIQIALSAKTWTSIGMDMEKSRRTIPTSYGRALRNISKYHGSFKAEEWSSYLLYYSPVLLRDRLAPELYQHHMKLVTAIEIVIDYEITQDDLDKARTLLMQFVSDYERLYYRYNQKRIRACLSTVHLLLHVTESIADCGPAWVYWQFPCERLCGLLKPKVKNRALFNRNLSLAVLQDQQMNHLPYATTFSKPPIHRSLPAVIQHIGGKDFNFFKPSTSTQLATQEISHLITYYMRLLSKTRTEIRGQLEMDVVKFARCKLPNDVDRIMSIWYEERRSMVTSARQSSVMQYSEYLRNDMDQIEINIRFGRISFFFLHSFNNIEYMLAYVQRYTVTDHSRQMDDVREGKVIEIVGDGRKEVICVSAIETGVGVMVSSGKRYIITRCPIIQTLHDED